MISVLRIMYVTVWFFVASCSSNDQQAESPIDDERLDSSVSEENTDLGEQDVPVDDVGYDENIDSNYGQESDLQYSAPEEDYEDNEPSPESILPEEVMPDDEGFPENTEYTEDEYGATRLDDSKKLSNQVAQLDTDSKNLFYGHSDPWSLSSFEQPDGSRIYKDPNRQFWDSNENEQEFRDQFESWLPGHNDGQFVVRLKRLNIHLGPSFEEEVIEVLPIGSLVHVQKKEGVWYRIGPDQYVHRYGLTDLRLRSYRGGNHKASSRK